MNPAASCQETGHQRGELLSTVGESTDGRATLDGEQPAPRHVRHH